MQRIPISLAQQGMVLARDVVKNDASNAVPICGKGVELSDSLIERLKNMGIQSVTVQGHPVWMEGDKTLEEMLADLDRRFRRVENDHLSGILKNIYREHLIRSRGE